MGVRIVKRQNVIYVFPRSNLAQYNIKVVIENINFDLIKQWSCGNR